MINVLTLLYWLVVVAAIVQVVMDNRQPAKTMAWVLVIIFVPVVGLLFYLFFGLSHRRERLISRRSLDELSKRSMLSFVSQHDLQVPDDYRQLADFFAAQDYAMPFKDSAVEPLTDGYAFVHALLRDIAGARHHVHICMYIFEDDALGRLVADALIAKARCGVEVRVVYDDVGCWKVSRRFFERLRTGGVELAPFLPVHFSAFTSKANYRNHRKVIVIDGRVGYIGGMNIALRYVKGIPASGSGSGADGGATLPWRDTMLRMTGGIVYGLQRVFLIDWYFVDRTLITGRQYYPPTEGAPPAGAARLAQVVTGSPASSYPVIMQGFVYAIMAARRYIYIETPYFMPTEPVLFALKMAALSGVDVRVICPLRSDGRFTDWASRSYLRELHAAGATISLYRAGFMHSKLMVCDDAMATCGSTNVDFRSFENNFEANVFIYDAGVARQLKAVFLADEAQSTDLSALPQRLRPRFMQHLWESVVRLLSPLL